MINMHCVLLRLMLSTTYLKRFDQERLHHVVERAHLELAKSQDRETTRRILDLLSRVKSELPIAPSSEGRLVIRAKGARRVPQLG
jgi:hypothetical protein